MRRSRIAFVLFLICQATFAQSDTASLEQYFADCIEIPPKYPGGTGAMRKLFADNMRYPKESVRYGQSGTVHVIYMVDTLGNTSNINVQKSAGAEFDAEAIRHIKMLRKWKPATLNGRKVVYYQKQPFVFVLEKSNQVKRCSTKTPS